MGKVLVKFLKDWQFQLYLAYFEAIGEESLFLKLI